MHNLKEIRKDFSNFEKSLEKRSLRIDFSNLQKLDEEQLQSIVALGSKVRQFISSPPSTTTNIGEYCKKEIFLTDIKNANLNRLNYRRSFVN